MPGQQKSQNNHLVIRIKTATLLVAVLQKWRLEWKRQ